VQGFEDTGVLLFCTDDWRITNVVATSDLEYGIFPSHSGPGRVDHSSASGANDTGIYVGQSHDVTVDHNLATGNVSGFEIENSSGVRLFGNDATGNTAGILSFTLPFLDVTENAGNRIDHNFVHDNDKANTCEPGDIVCAVPPGSGIAVVAADANTVDHNTVTGNDSFGILVANICNALQLPPAVCAVLDIEPNSDDARIVFDTALDNGENPAPGFPLPGGDLLWDGTGTGDCWATTCTARASRRRCRCASSDSTATVSLRAEQRLRSTERFGFGSGDSREYREPTRRRRCCFRADGDIERIDLGRHASPRRTERFAASKLGAAGGALQGPRFSGLSGYR